MMSSNVTTVVKRALPPLLKRDLRRQEVVRVSKDYNLSALMRGVASGVRG